MVAGNERWIVFFNILATNNHWCLSNTIFGKVKLLICGCCANPIEGPSYCCSSRKFSLHKRCAELELAPTINHPFHPKHLLNLVTKSPSGAQLEYRCDFCRKTKMGFFYRCAYCNFNLDVNCALLPTPLAENFPSSLHKHPLILVENHHDDFKHNCKACKKILSAPVYKCFHCRDFSLHKECGELPLQINHPYDRLHHLSLFPNPVSHQEECTCYSCKIIKWDGFVYGCSVCNIDLTLEDVSAPQTITNKSHEHPWTLVSSPISFTCDFCGLDGNRTPYICTTCHLIVHRNCTSLPRTIRIARHQHPISHVYFLQQIDQLEELECRICYDKVMARYGSYFCSASDCNYIAHVHCATHKNIWDGTIVLEGDEMFERSGNSVNMNMITNVISEVTVGEDVMAMEIKHAFHRHNLILNLKDEINDDGNICNGCMMPIFSTPYNCQECRFFLHKSCAELPRVKGHPIHKHLLKLVKSYDTFRCTACGRLHNGFMYNCDQDFCYYGYRGFKIDIQCSLLPDSLSHPSHEHSLFLSHDYKGDCSGCSNKGITLAYRCTKPCDFAVDIRCLRLQQTARYKYDKHPLTLAYHDNSDPNQVYCDICEEERDSNHLFYYCAHCDNSVHEECVLGQQPFLEIGSKHVTQHRHYFTLVDNIWNCPKCAICGKICYRQGLECKACKYTVHWNCCMK